MGRSATPHRALLRIAITLTLTTAVLPTVWAASEPLKPSVRATQLLKEAKQNERLIAQAQQSEYRLEDMYGTEVSFSQDRGASPGYAQSAPSYDNKAEHQRQDQAKAAFRSAKTGDDLLAIEGVPTDTCMAYRNGKWVAERCKTAVPEGDYNPPPPQRPQHAIDYDKARSRLLNIINPYLSSMGSLPPPSASDAPEDVELALGRLLYFVGSWARAYETANYRLETLDPEIQSQITNRETLINVANQKLLDARSYLASHPPLVIAPLRSIVSRLKQLGEDKDNDSVQIKKIHPALPWVTEAGYRSSPPQWK